LERPRVHRRLGAAWLAEQGIEPAFIKGNPRLALYWNAHPHQARRAFNAEEFVAVRGSRRRHRLGGGAQDTARVHRDLDTLTRPQFAARLERGERVRQALLVSDQNPRRPLPSEHLAGCGWNGPKEEMENASAAQHCLPGARLGMGTKLPRSLGKGSRSEPPRTVG
jgi:hypothetical protein